MRVLIVTKIFPNRLEPHSSAFNRQQFTALARTADIEIMATIPWFPGAKHFARWSRAGRLLQVPEIDSVGTLGVQHPRVFYLPKFGNRISGHLYAASLLSRAIEKRGRTDVVLGSWGYPDGFAATVLGDLLGTPSVVKLHGSDINVLSRIPVTRRGLERTLGRATRVVAVSHALAESAARLGVEPDRIDVVPNGVDTSLFFPNDREKAREELGIGSKRKILLYVGRIEREKGVLDLIRAYSSSRELAKTKLMMIGEGSGLRWCRDLIQRLDLPVELLGSRPHREIARFMAASDVVTLPSWNEGMPNVVLEALASGRRVVATRVGAIPDLVDSPILGALVPTNHPSALSAALERALFLDYDPEEVRAAADVIDWTTSAGLLKRSLLRALESQARRAA